MPHTTLSANSSLNYVTLRYTPHPHIKLSSIYRQKVNEREGRKRVIKALFIRLQSEGAAEASSGEFFIIFAKRRSTESERVRKEQKNRYRLLLPYFTFSFFLQFSPKKKEIAFPSRNYKNVREKHSGLRILSVTTCNLYSL